MNATPIDLGSLRAQKARLGRRIGKTGYIIILSLMFVFTLLAGTAYFVDQPRVVYLSGSLALFMLIGAAWYKLELLPLKTGGTSLNDKLSGDILARLTPGQKLNPQIVWRSLRSHWHSVFLSNHFLIPLDIIEQCMSPYEQDMSVAWTEASRLADECHSDIIEPAHLVGGLLITSAGFRNHIHAMKLSDADIEAVVMWLGRALELVNTEKPYFGGVGRDWATGFTPRLNQFGINISRVIEHHGSSFGWLASSPGVTAMRSAFSQGAAAVALVGEPGVGKTSHVNALAQVLLAEKTDRNLEHRQIVALNPSTILSSAKGPGELEDIVMSLLIETSHAGNIILFLDDAQLFFSDGHGAFDMTRILLPILQNRSVQMVMAMTPRDYQQLRIDNAAFANLLSPVMLSEQSEQDTMRVLEDNALSLEHSRGTLISYEALKEAYRLSGRYMQDEAYPGKALQLLKNSLSYAETKGIITAASIQKAIEQSTGVKVGSAAPVEADALLNLEDKIHERMINQSHAVHVVAGALRRARAGVSNPKRPIGSFLFLGPTGVGKTELAKAIAATYFKAEENIIRLDMSEYQQPDDVQRILSNGASTSSSLIMAVRKQPFSVVLLDEIEKAHPNVLNLLLQLLDEGQLTDNDGRPVSFKDCVIIITSNAGADIIRERISRGEALETFQAEFTNHLISSGQFKPELLNRFDEIVLFRPLDQKELSQVVALMMNDINKTLASQNISVELTPSAVMQIVEMGYDARLGARPMRRALQTSVEDGIAYRILRGETRPGDHVVLDVDDLAK